MRARRKIKTTKKKNAVSRSLFSLVSLWLLSIASSWSIDASAQIPCGNADGINCESHPDYGWIVRGSAPARVDSDDEYDECWDGRFVRESECPPVPVAIPEEVITCWSGERLPASQCPYEPESSLWTKRREATLDAWENRQGLPSDNTLLIDQLIAEREDARNVEFPDRLYLYQASLRGYHAGIGYWELAQEEFAKGRVTGGEQMIDRAVALLRETALEDSETDYGLRARAQLFQWHFEWTIGTAHAWVPESLKEDVRLNPEWFRRAWPLHATSMSARYEEIEQLVRAREEEERERRTTEAQLAVTAGAGGATNPATNDCDAFKVDYEASIREVRGQMAADSTNPLYPAALASHLTRVKQYDAALAEFERALSLDPNYSVFYGRAQTFANMGRLEDAFADLERADLPGGVPAMREAVQGRAAMENRDYASAIPHFEKMNELWANDFAKLELAEAFWRAGRQDDALAQAEKAIAASDFPSVISDTWVYTLNKLKCTSR